MAAGRPGYGATITNRFAAGPAQAEQRLPELDIEVRETRKARKARDAREAQEATDAQKAREALGRGRAGGQGEPESRDADA